jgi:hypothetical protein
MSEAILQSNIVPKPDVNVGQDEPGDDPWKGVFSPGGDGELTTGFYDGEDGGVWRCLDDMHEILNGVCTSCGRVYRVPNEPNGDDLDLDGLERLQAINNMLFDGHNLWRHLSDLSDEGEDDDDMARTHIPMFGLAQRQRLPRARLLHGMPFHDDEDEDEMDTDDDGWRERLRSWVAGPRRRPTLEDDDMEVRSDDEDEEDEEEDGSYEGSFIDDGADEGGDDQGQNRSSNTRPQNTALPTVNLRTDSDLDEPDWNRAARRLGARARAVVLSDVEADLTSPAGRPNPDSMRPNNSVVMISDEEEQEDLEEAVPRRPRRRRIPSISPSELSEEIVIDREGPARPRPPARMPSIDFSSLSDDDSGQEAEP